MHKGIGATAAALVGLCVTQGAHANVVYNFEADAGTGGSYVQATGGQIVVTDAAYRSGSLNRNYTPGGAGEPFTGTVDDPYPDSPIISAEINVDAGRTPAILSAYASPRNTRFVIDAKTLQANLQFRDDGLLDGSLFIFDTAENVRSNGQGADWRVTDFNSDYFGTGPCTGNSVDPCFAGTGRWVIDEDTRPVPAPAAGLLGFGLIGLAGLVRRRRALASG
ncbi:hypothetical protein SAOR_13380 [Salinisphaera orenii MK-B5]|uniref:PEP-CTERM protein-sorting domain-containing protein n=1 Tax=Salinisphaera orenii MK-B5 TaxID=856730 RepID=A0A423PHF7_9GAMM|nr:hypothetical protein SAOR_13380 [Salinisphaera orenii MK-B5]